MFDSQTSQEYQELCVWLASCRQRAELAISPISWQACTDWIVTAHAIEHKTGGFFSIRGLACAEKAGRHPAFALPMIDQPEIGILGFVLKRTPQGIEWLLQAKTEPGNYGGTQIAPTVQATESNYKQRHEGAPTPYLDLFLNPGENCIVADSLGSEQGSRFIGKYNRNMSVLLEHHSSEPAVAALRWFSSAVLRKLLLADYSLNTDARSSLFTGDWTLLANEREPFSACIDVFGKALSRSFQTATQGSDAVVEWLAGIRSSAHSLTRVLSLYDLPEWELTEFGLLNKGYCDLQIRPYAVSTNDREVNQWCQPLLQSTRLNQCVLYCQVRDGVMMFLLRASWEIGFKEGYQLGPTWQSDAMGVQSQSIVELVQSRRGAEVCRILQSDEGGRFLDSLCGYQLWQLEDEAKLSVGNDYRWLTLGQIHALRNRQSILTNEARSLLSMLLAWA